LLLLSFDLFIAGNTSGPSLDRSHPIIHRGDSIAAAIFDGLDAPVRRYFRAKEATQQMILGNGYFWESAKPIPARHWGSHLQTAPDRVAIHRIEPLDWLDASVIRRQASPSSSTARASL